MSVTIDVEYLGDLHCRAVHGPSGHELQTDAPTDNGGRGAAFSPTDLVATALAACLSTVMGLTARRTGLPLEGMRIRVVKEMTANPVRRIGALKATVVLPGGCRLSADDRVRLERSANTCPVKQSLHPDVHVDIRFEYPE